MEAIRKRRFYGQWAGDPKGTPENETKCYEEIWDYGVSASWVPRQCSRKRGFGKDGLYCKQHAKQHNK